MAVRVAKIERFEDAVVERAVELRRRPRIARSSARASAGRSG